MDREAETRSIQLQTRGLVRRQKWQVRIGKQATRRVRIRHGRLARTQKCAAIHHQ